MTTTDTEAFDLGYFATGEAAQEFTGYTGLGGYTILTTAVPEPGICVLIGLGAAVLLIFRRPKRVASASSRCHKNSTPIRWWPEVCWKCRSTRD